MDPLAVDNTYATALYEAASEEKSIEAIGEELKDLSQVFDKYPELMKLLLVPTIPATKKKEAAGKIFEGKLSPLVMNFIYILIDKRRVGSWKGIVRTYEKLIDIRDGLSKGIIYSVLPLEKKEVAAFEAETGKVLAKKVKLENRVDDSLIGGVRIYVEGKLIDISIRHRLELLKQAMLNKH